MESGKPLDPQKYVPVTDPSGAITILVSGSMAFEGNRVFIEYFTHGGKDIFICRTVISQ